MKKDENIKHVAIIMDGNRRWAKKHHLPSMMGHKKGIETLKTIVKAASKFNIKYLTVYAFSTENWNREKSEVDFLMNLLSDTIKNELDELYDNNVKINYIGNLKQLNPNLQKILDESEKKTKNNNGVILNVAINYGARDEMVNAIKNMVKDDVEINEKTVSKYLYTKDSPDPDLLIRTSGEKRISNFLLWQIAYSEIYVTDTLWPDFDEEEFKKALDDFKTRKRRWGK